MTNTRWIIAVLVALLVGGVIGVWVGKDLGRETGEVSESDTVLVVDTVRDTIRQMVKEAFYKWKEVPVVVENPLTEPAGTVAHDTTKIYIRDSVAVVPIVMRTFTDSTTYKAVVSGYEPNLEEIEVYQKTTTITNVRDRKWSVGIQGGLYLTPKGVQPGIGIGVNWKPWK